VVSFSDMSTTFAGFPASAPVNSLVSGTANFVNTSATGTATTATFSLKLPAGLTGVVVSSPILGAGTYNAGSGVVTFAAAPSVVNVTPSATVSASISFNQTSTGVTGTGNTSALNDTNAANGTGTFTVAASAADMSTTFAGFPASAVVGSTVSGTVNFVNTSATGTATTATFSLKLPAGLTGVVVNSAVLGAGTYNAGSGVVTFAAAPSVVNVTPSATVSASISFNQTTTGVTGTGNTSALNDTNLANNTATFSVANSTADMSASFVGFPSGAAAGSTVSGAVNFVNIGATTAATAPTMTLQLSPGLGAGNVTVTSAVLGTGTYNNASGAVTFANPPPASLAARGTISASISYKQAGTFVRGTATTSATNDTNPANNTSTFYIGTGATASISGRVFQDISRNKIYDPGVDQPVANFRAEIVKTVNGVVTVFGSAITDANGQYRIDNLTPGTGYSLRFSDSGGVGIFGTPFNEGVVSGGQQVTQNGNPSTGTNTNTGAVTPGPTTPVASQIDNITLYAGDVVELQNLPFDPSGVVYDSVTRQPLAGATVRLVYEGSGVFNPALQLIGASDTVVTGLNGVYQFLFNTANNPPPGVYRLDVTPPADYNAPHGTQGEVGPDQGMLLLNAGGDTFIQPNYLAPAVGVNGVTPVTGFTNEKGTQYFLRLNFSFAGYMGAFTNHIPLDKKLAPGALLVSKTGNKTVAELGDSVQYTIRIRNTTALPISRIVLGDTLPAGFRYILETSRLGGVVIPNPAGGIGRDLSFGIGTIAGNATAELTYFVRLGVGSQQGDGVNRAFTTTPVRSNVATFKVSVQGGVFSNEGCIIGKVYVDCDGNAVQNSAGGSRELGIPGVRLVMLDGTFILTDSEGKYSICGIKSQTHVIKVDRTTLPKGSRLVPSSNRNAGVGDSIFVDLKGGELGRADFIEGSCSPEVLDQVKARRAQGGVTAPETEKTLPLTIQNRPGEAQQQILPNTRQQDALPAIPGVVR
jgi:uncharacterized repeat protein (TIGR01451 family)